MQNELLTELLLMLDQNVIRIQPYTLDDSQRPTIEARILNWIGRARIATRARDPYRWRPIAEIHEDLGPCVLIRLDDPGYMEVGSNLDEDFNETGWTHFAEVPKLMNDEAEQLRAAMDPRHCYLCDRPKLDCACEVAA